jgi:hypothetical protein
MKIKESKLRQIIRSVILREAPLDFIGGYDVPADPADDQGPRPSIAYGKSTSPEFRQHAKVLMQNVPDGWAIITLSNVRNARINIRSESFKGWLLDQGIPESSRVIVVGDEALDGDFDSPEWVIVHDIIGHSMSTGLGGIGGGYYWDTIAEYIHEILPAHLRLGEAGDKLPDVLGAIFTGQVDRDDVDGAVQKYVMELRGWHPHIPEEHEKIRREVRDIVEILFQHIEYWKNSIIPGKPELIHPF